VAKILKTRVCVCDDCAREVVNDSALTWRYDESTAKKRKHEITNGLNSLEEIGGYLFGPVEDTIESSDEKCEVCGISNLGYRHIFELREIPDTEEAVKIIMARRAEERKISNQINKASKAVLRHSKNIGKEFNNNIYFCWAVIIIITLLYFLAK
jgi:hypothetical protein